MPTSSVGATNNSVGRRHARPSVGLRHARPSYSERGITLLEMLIVMTIVALVAGLTFPSIATGLDSLRLRSASDSIVSLLNTALDRADRRQQAVEITISPKENSIVARSADLV